MKRTFTRTAFLAFLLALPVRGASNDKLIIESPQASQKFSCSRIAVSVKVSPEVHRVKAVVTVEEPEDKTKTLTLFSVGPKEAPKGADHWKYEVELAAGKNTITVSDGDDPGASAQVAVENTGDAPASDTRDTFEASFYAGASIDSFAGGELKKYYGYGSPTSQAGQDLQQASGPQTGYVAGIDFAYRLTKRRWPAQLWLYGETVHGQRSTEVDCTAAKASPVCAGFTPGNAADAFLAILRNSTSLEAYGGLRFEFLRLNRSDTHSVSVYAKTQVGFMTVQSNGADVVDDHIKAALGLIMTNGPFRDSYFEAGYGRSDLFYLHRGRRLKVDGCVQWKVADNIPFYPFF